jgi:PIN domain nuclease of toxin-antitoxin system
MNYLLDTHTLLWFINGDASLSENAKAIIKDYNNNCSISIASIWEIGIKISLKKLQLGFDFEALETFLINNEIGILNINIKHVEILSSLPFIHRDPFDRILIAQCMVEKTVLLTKDESINLYQTIETIW